MISISLVVIIWFTAQSCVSIFNRENSILLNDYAILGLRFYFLGFPLAAVNMIQAGYLSAVDCAIESTVISVSRGIVAIVVFAVILSYILGLTGVWIAFFAAELFTLVLSVTMQKKYKPY